MNVEQDQQPTGSVRLSGKGVARVIECIKRGLRTPRSGTQLIIGVTLFLVIFDNIPFFRAVAKTYPLTWSGIAFIASLAVVLACVIFIPLALVCFRITTKPVLMLILMLSATTGYFTYQYGIIMDIGMIQNTFQTNAAEAFDLVTADLMLWVFALGIVPCLILLFIPQAPISFGRELRSRLKFLGLSIGLILVCLFGFHRTYASFFREHKPVRSLVNPTYTLYSLQKFARKSVGRGSRPFTPIGTDAAIPPTDTDRELIILVVGESVRSDHVSLNGYPRETMPLLAQEPVMSFTQMSACATSTATSVPCMFSVHRRSGFDSEEAVEHSNVLDILAGAGVHVLWRDNNSDSKHVADRVLFEDFRTSDLNPICDIECRDLGMLDGLQSFIDGQAEGDILIVLHQMGNHGPAYFRRYPEDFEVFTPACRTAELQDCSVEEIINAYDNAIRYTDTFLSRVIALLKDNDASFETALLYISDHGESLGEHGIYLHGFPYTIAPEEQVHIAAIFWFGQNFDIDIAAMKQIVDQPFSHDNVFHTVLGLFEIETELYDRSLDMTAPYRLEP